MAMSHRAARTYLAAKNLLLAPISSSRRIASVEEQRRGLELAQHWAEHDHNTTPAATHDGEQDNPLRAYFNGVTEGPGVWKWIHYFEPYHRHLQKFIGRPVTVVEIGVYSGGSLAMWKRYFGEGCRIHGVDIEDSCRCYDDAVTKIHIGDQANRDFWRTFRDKVPVVDVLIDDGGHTSEQQMVTLEEMLPHLRPGGVYICEDVHSRRNEFATFAHSLADELNAMTRVPYDNGIKSDITRYQSAIHSMHFYPYMVVVEKCGSPRILEAPKHGTRWQPFPMSDSDPRYRSKSDGSP